MIATQYEVALPASCVTRRIMRLAPEANPIDAVQMREEHPGEEGVHEVLHFSEPKLEAITAG